MNQDKEIIKSPMNPPEIFVREYKKACAATVASRELAEAARRYVWTAKAVGVSQSDTLKALQSLMRRAGGRTPETAELDSDLFIHCVEEYARPEAFHEPSLAALTA